MPGEDTKLALAASMRQRTDSILAVCKRSDDESTHQPTLLFNQRIRQLVIWLREEFTETTGVQLPPVKD